MYGIDLLKRNNILNQTNIKKDLTIILILNKKIFSPYSISYATVIPIDFLHL